MARIDSKRTLLGSLDTEVVAKRLLYKLLFISLGSPLEPPVEDRPQRPHSDYAADILTSGRYLLDIINDILDLAKIEAGEMELAESSIDPVQLMEKCLRLTNERVESSGLTLSTHFDHGGCQIIGDNRKLQQILINLLANAIKFTNRGGNISLRTAMEENGQFVFEVKDSGIGIAETDIPKILSPFGQIDSSLARETTGTGLGLPLIKSLIDLQGGMLTISSAIGKGTTMRVSLPAYRIENCSAISSGTKMSR